LFTYHHPSTAPPDERARELPLRRSSSFEPLRCISLIMLMEGKSSPGERALFPSTAQWSLTAAAETGMSTTSASLGPLRRQSGTHGRLNCMDAPPAAGITTSLMCHWWNRKTLVRSLPNKPIASNQTSGTCSLSINTSRLHFPDPSDSILAGIGQLRSPETDLPLSSTAPGTSLAASKRGGGKVVCSSSRFLPDCSHPNHLCKSFIHSTLISYPFNCPLLIKAIADCHSFGRRLAARMSISFTPSMTSSSELPSSQTIASPLDR
jgi:hypothetical protein